MSRYLICGGREWTNLQRIKLRLGQLHPDKDIVIHGGCRGADKLAGKAADDLGIPVEVYPAEWQRHGAAAGPIRNGQMLDMGIDYVIAFHPALVLSKGTRDCVTQAHKKGIPVEVINE